MAYLCFEVFQILCWRINWHSNYWYKCQQPLSCFNFSYLKMESPLLKFKIMQHKTRNIFIILIHTLSLPSCIGFQEKIIKKRKICY